MRIGIGQIIVVIIISFLLFGDFDNLKKKSMNFFEQIKEFVNDKNRKKGT